MGVGWAEEVDKLKQRLQSLFLGGVSCFAYLSSGHCDEKGCRGVWW